jgi:hypothetical protein
VCALLLNRPREFPAAPPVPLSPGGEFAQDAEGVLDGPMLRIKKIFRPVRSMLTEKSRSTVCRGRCPRRLTNLPMKSQLAAICKQPKTHLRSGTEKPVRSRQPKTHPEVGKKKRSGPHRNPGPVTLIPPPAAFSGTPATEGHPELWPDKRSRWDNRGQGVQAILLIGSQEEAEFHLMLESIPAG